MIRITTLFSVTLLIALLMGCIAAVPYAVKVYKERDFVKLDIVADGQALDLYDTLDRYSIQKSPNRVVEKNDREKLKFEGNVTKPSGRVYFVEWEVEQLNPQQAKIDFMVKAEEDGEPINEQELNGLAFEAIDSFCKRTERKCTIEFD